MMIRPAQISDFDFFYRLYMHPLCNPYLLYEPMEEAAFQPIFRALLEEEVIFVFEVENQPAGMFKLIRLKHRTDHVAYLGGVAIAPEYMGKGHGAAMMKAILDFGKTLGLLRIELSTSTGNTTAQKLYEKCGFQQEGILRRYTHLKKEGEFLDEVLMAYLYD